MAEKPKIKGKVKKKEQAKVNTEVTFPIENIQWVSVEDVVPNEYNPNKMNPPTFKAFCKHMDDAGVMYPITVTKKRKTGSDKGKHVIVDGEHRWKYLKAKNADKVPVVVDERWNPDSPSVRQKFATLAFNIHGANDGIKLGYIFKEALMDGYTVKDIAESTAYDPEDVNSALSFVEFTPVSGDVQEAVEGAEDEDDGDNGFLTIELVVPKDAWPNIEEQFQRVCRLANIHDDDSESVEYGRALELMAANVASTPDESLV